MGVDFDVVLEYDGEDSVRNDFVCELDNFVYPSLRKWDGAYEGDLRDSSNKKHSLKTEEYSKYYICLSWGLNKIAPKIKSIKKIEVKQRIG